MAKRLAITVAGAVSLGSFEAGVLYEVISALAQHNSNPETTADDRIEIDVITGASAGGMSATVAAQKLMFDADALDGAYQNSFYRAWVQDVSLDGLLKLQPDEDPTHSILSSDLVEAISKKHITQRYQSHVTPSIKHHPAAAATVRLGLALSNLNGVDYSQPTWPSGSFTYTRYQDELCVAIDGTPKCDNENLWEPLRNAAVSCGAFPMAFRLKELFRHVGEYPGASKSSFPSEVERFTYTDGGVFQNEPIGLAKNLVDEVDHHFDVDSRFYLFVSPGARSSTANPTFSESQANFKNAGVGLAKCIFQQARFHDWIMAESVNAQVQLFNDRALGLLNAIVNRQISAAALEQTAQPILALFFNPANARAQQQLSGSEVRLRAQFASDYQRLIDATDRATADSWVRAILAFETAADLGTRDEMYICSVTADESELASAGIMAFLGFFDQRYRDHDYDVGRTKAQAFLLNPPAQLGAIRFTPGVIRPIDSSLNGLRLQDVPRPLRQQLKDRLNDRARDILQEMGVPTVVIRDAIDYWLISPQLNKLLDL